MYTANSPGGWPVITEDRENGYIVRTGTPPNPLRATREWIWDVADSTPRGFVSLQRDGPDRRTIFTFTFDNGVVTYALADDARLDVPQDGEIEFELVHSRIDFESAMEVDRAVAAHLSEEDGR